MFWLTKSVSKFTLKNMGLTLDVFFTVGHHPSLILTGKVRVESS